MAANHTSELLSIADLKVYEVLTDVNGGSTTYGAAVDWPDVTGATLSFSTDTKTRRGDGTVKSQRLILSGVTLKVTNTTYNMDVLALVEGGTVTDSGTGSAEIATYSYTSASTPKYVKVEALCNGLSSGLNNCHLVIYKAQLTTPADKGFTDDDFQTLETEFGSVARDSDGKIYDLGFYEAATALSA